MRVIVGLLFGLMTLSINARIATAEPQYIDDPDKYAAEAMRQISNNEVASVSKMISDTIGKPSYAENLQNALNALASRKIGYTDKVVDHSFGKSLRQIVYYCFVENIGFIYFRFNYKMSEHGWILANFIFKTETNELFPKDFVDPPN
jgi:hypothetical protein